jgi:hypothetical protein
MIQGGMIKGGMTGPGTIAWFAQHEMRLAWRDWVWLLSGGHSRHWYIGALGLGEELFFLFFDVMLDSLAE